MKIKVGKLPVIKEIPAPKVPTGGIPLEVISQMITEYSELKKVKEVEKTKRLKIKKETKVKLKKLDTFEKLASKVIERNLDMREKLLDSLIKQLENTEDVEKIDLFLRGIIETLNTDSIKKNIEAININFPNNDEI